MGELLFFVKNSIGSTFFYYEVFKQQQQQKRNKKGLAGSTSVLSLIWKKKRKKGKKKCTVFMVLWKIPLKNQQFENISRRGEKWEMADGTHRVLMERREISAALGKHCWIPIKCTVGAARNRKVGGLSSVRFFKAVWRLGKCARAGLEESLLEVFWERTVKWGIKWELFTPNTGVISVIGLTLCFFLNASLSHTAVKYSLRGKSAYDSRQPCFILLD